MVVGFSLALGRRTRFLPQGTLGRHCLHCLPTSFEERLLHCLLPSFLAGRQLRRGLVSTPERRPGRIGPKSAGPLSGVGRQRTGRTRGHGCGGKSSGRRSFGRREKGGRVCGLRKVEGGRRVEGCGLVCARVQGEKRLPCAQVMESKMRGCLSTPEVCRPTDLNRGDRNGSCLEVPKKIPLVSDRSRERPENRAELCRVKA